MKKGELAALRRKDRGELLALIATKKKDLLDAIKKDGKKEGKKKVRHEIAQILTIVREAEIEASA